MKNLCQGCEKNPARGNHFLCYSCQQRENRADVVAVELQINREFKFEMRELVNTVPALQRRYR